LLEIKSLLPDDVLQVLRAVLIRSESAWPHLHLDSGIFTRLSCLSTVDEAKQTILQQYLDSLSESCLLEKLSRDTKTSPKLITQAQQRRNTTIINLTMYADMLQALGAPAAPIFPEKVELSDRSFRVAADNVISLVSSGSSFSIILDFLKDIGGGDAMTGLDPLLHALPFEMATELHFKVLEDQARTVARLAATNQLEREQITTRLDDRRLRESERERQEPRLRALDTVSELYSACMDFIMVSEADRRQLAESSTGYKKTVEIIVKRDLSKELVLLAQKHVEKALQDMDAAISTLDTPTKDQTRLHKAVRKIQESNSKTQLPQLAEIGFDIKLPDDMRILSTEEISVLIIGRSSQNDNDVTSNLAAIKDFEGKQSSGFAASLGNIFGSSSEAQKTGLELRNLALILNRSMYQAIMRKIGDVEANDQINRISAFEKHVAQDELAKMNQRKARRKRQNALAERDNGQADAKQHRKQLLDALNAIMSSKLHDCIVDMSSSRSDLGEICRQFRLVVSEFLELFNHAANLPSFQQLRLAVEDLEQWLNHWGGIRFLRQCIAAALAEVPAAGQSGSHLFSLASDVEELLRPGNRLPASARVKLSMGIEKISVFLFKYSPRKAHLLIELRDVYDSVVFGPPPIRGADLEGVISLMHSTLEQIPDIDLVADQMLDILNQLWMPDSTPLTHVWEAYALGDTVNPSRNKSLFLSLWQNTEDWFRDSKAAESSPLSSVFMDALKSLSFRAPRGSTLGQTLSRLEQALTFATNDLPIQLREATAQKVQSVVTNLGHPDKQEDAVFHLEQGMAAVMKSFTDRQVDAPDTVQVLNAVVREICRAACTPLESLRTLDSLLVRITSELGRESDFELFAARDGFMEVLNSIPQGNARELIEGSINELSFILTKLENHFRYAQVFSGFSDIELVDAKLRSVMLTTIGNHLKLSPSEFANLFPEQITEKLKINGCDFDYSEFLELLGTLTQHEIALFLADKSENERIEWELVKLSCQRVPLLQQKKICGSVDYPDYCRISNCITHCSAPCMRGVDLLV